MKYFNYTMNDKKYAIMLLRRRFCKRMSLVVVIFVVSFYVSAYLFGGIGYPRVSHLTDLSRCPACYGVSVCPELYSNQISLDSGNHWHTLFNAKNVYHGYTEKNRRVIMKKLAQNKEFMAFDLELCSNWGLKNGCKPIQLLEAKDIENKIKSLVAFNLSYYDTEPRAGLVFCPYVASFFDFIEPLIDKKKKKNDNQYNSDLINVWTMLKLNPEPIILQILKKNQGWPVPAYGGVCGRLEIVANEGESLSLLKDIEWHRKLKIAKLILDAAMDFTFKHERFRFYLMDWSLDNIVVDSKDKVTFVDLEDVIVLDKLILPRTDLPNWYKRYNRDDPDTQFTFSIDSICKHHLSDHNLWAACYVLAGEDAFLYPMGEYDKNLHALFQECLKGTDRFHTISLLQHYILDMTSKETHLGYGASRI